MSSVTIDTTDYKFANGRAPRGHGSWAFFPDRCQRLHTAIWKTGTYSEAKAAAITEARTRGIHTLYLGT
jgi:hypothetical protein